MAKIPANTIIIGLTGSVCSGCSVFAKWLNESKDYEYYSLSEPIHSIAQEKLKNGEIEEITQDELQDIGNNIRRENGTQYLAELALQNLDAKYAEKPFDKIVIDSIRNLGEVKLFREWPRFYLISVYANFDDRWNRWSNLHRDKGVDYFKQVDNRDAEENILYGQQVKDCCDESDIAINNPKPDQRIDFHNPRSRDAYIDRKISKYLTLIENGPQLDFRPKTDEKLMTIAYLESLSSSCSQRKVGAVIATDAGDVLSTGHNHVPEGEEPCQKLYDGCFRKYLRKKHAELIKYCPQCGEKIIQKCSNCDTEIFGYSANCGHCGADIKFDYECIKCHSQVYEELTIGGKKSIGKGLDVCRALHAEENAIISLAKTGRASAENNVLYSTTFPCTLCANKIVQSNIKRVVYSEPYTMPEAERLLKNKGIEIERFEGVKSTAFFRLYGTELEA